MKYITKSMNIKHTMKISTFAAFQQPYPKYIFISITPKIKILQEFLLFIRKEFKALSSKQIKCWPA